MDVDFTNSGLQTVATGELTVVDRMAKDARPSAFAYGYGIALAMDASHKSAGDLKVGDRMLNEWGEPREVLSIKPARSSGYLDIRTSAGTFVKQKSELVQVA